MKQCSLADLQLEQYRNPSRISLKEGLAKPSNTAMKAQVVRVDATEALGKLLIPNLCALLKSRQQQVVFFRQADHLDIDTPNKDSYELFAAGLDFAMLVTDKQRYLKSRHDVSAYLPIPPEVDWLIQDAAVYPTDICLTVTDNAIMTDCGKQFSLSSLTPLINWLVQNDK